MKWQVKHRTAQDERGRAMYWSNAHGWVLREDADTFTTREQETLRLPIGGKWVPRSAN